ncbi:MAG: ribonuclease HIII [Mycoplasma sp.]
MSNNLSIKLNKQEISIILKKLAKYEIPPSNIYVYKQYKYKSCSILIYKTDKLLIQGNDADKILEEILGNNKLTSQSSSTINQLSIGIIGSDEVGVGDFYGGLVVAAAYVDPSSITWLKAIGVKDSKLLNDEQMYEIFKKIKDKIPFVCSQLNPEQYNSYYDKLQNSHILKAILHNDALTKLSSKIPEQHKIVVDEFASASNYYKYLKTANVQAQKVDLFKQKAESQFVAVACASIIARVYFLEQMKKNEQIVKTHLPLGASNPNIKKIAKKIISIHGKNVLSKICKMHFRTYNEIIGE